MEQKYYLNLIMKYLKKLIYDFEVLAHRLRELAFLNKGIAITLIDKREEERIEKYHYEGGIKEFVILLK